MLKSSVIASTQLPRTHFYASSFLPKQSVFSLTELQLVTIRLKNTMMKKMQSGTDNMTYRTKTTVTSGHSYATTAGAIVSWNPVPVWLFLTLYYPILKLKLNRVRELVLEIRCGSK